MIDAPAPRLAETTETLLKSPGKLVASISQGKDLRGLPLQLCLLAVVGFGSFGFVLGLTHSPLQGLLAAPKLALVGLGSLAICFPALHVYGRVMGNPSSPQQSVCEALAALALGGLTLMALSPVWLALSHLGFGSPSSYPLLILAAMGVLAFAGLRGMGAVARALRANGRAGAHLRAWAVLYGLVALQMAWLVRPIVGAPGEGPVVLARPLDRTSFQAVWATSQSAARTMSGQGR
jgi:hypothetical protein